MSILSKRELIDQSIENIFKLLIAVGSTPSNYAHTKHIVTALRSQGKLCSLDIIFSIGNEQLTIHPISLNTLKKRLAEKGIDRDLQHLDKLRIHAMDAIRSFGKELETPKKRTRPALEDQVTVLKESIAKLHGVNMVLIQALEINRRDLITISNTPNTGLRQKRINEAISRIIRILGLNPTPFDEVTLMSMSKHLQLVPDEESNR